MRKWIIIFIVIRTSNALFAQQKPQYTQYIFNNFLLNPAISGIENYTDVKLGYRNQWQGLDGAPVTSYVSAHLPLGEKFTYGTATSFPGEENNPMNRSYLQNYKASEPHHGMGFHLVHDKTGPLARVDLNLTYAYHLGITEKLNLAAGVAIGINRMQLDRSKVTLEEEADPAIGQVENLYNPDLGLGLWLYGPRYFAGISAQQLLSRAIEFNDSSIGKEGKQVPHYFLTAGFKAYLSDDIAAIPSFMLKRVSPSPLSLDMNLKVAFKDKFWLGGSWRKDDSAAAMAGFNFRSLFNLSYSYDFSTSSLRSVSNGSHEIVLGLLLNNRYKVTCPQKNW